jgi:hypothetical protein
MLFFVALAAYGQGEQNPLEYNYDYPRIGGEIGLSSSWQSGAYQAGCGFFQKGAKLNPILAVAYDKPVFTAGFRFEALLGYQGRSLASSYNSRENVVLNTKNGLVRVDVDFENLGVATFSYFFLLPSLRYNFSKAFYAGAGINLGLLVAKNTQYTKNIISKTVSLGEAGLSTVAYPESESSDPYSKVYPAEDLPNANGFGVDGALYLGAEFQVSRRFKVGPRLLYTIPLTAVLSNPDELKINSFQFLIGLRYDLFH